MPGAAVDDRHGMASAIIGIVIFLKGTVVDVGGTRVRIGRSKTQNSGPGFCQCVGSVSQDG